MLWRLVKRVLKVVAALVLLLVVSAAIAVGSVELMCRPPAPLAGTASDLKIDDANYRRTEADTYFTFPEWYIVYSFEDFGSFLQTKSESEFPYLSQIAGFWKSTCAANRIGAALPGDHFEYKQMIYVIGLSYTYEMAIKGLYEKTIGRLTEWLRGPTKTAEDAYAAAVIQNYGAFLNQVPWYEYPFMAKLAGLWRETPLVGASPARSIERKLSLSAEYLVKAGYARVIGLALAATSAPADLEIMFVVKGAPALTLASEPRVRLVRMLPTGDALLVAPRYQEFTELARRMAGNGEQFVEIAGNRRILVSAIVPAGILPEIPGTRELFSLPIDARPGFARIGYDVEVGSLSASLIAFKAAGVEVEHLYDY